LHDNFSVCHFFHPSLLSISCDKRKAGKRFSGAMFGGP
jgi:hypothetical protein